MIQGNTNPFSGEGLSWVLFIGDHCQLLQQVSVTRRDMGKVITLTFFVVPIIMPANLNFRQRLRAWLSQARGWGDELWIRANAKTILWSKVPTTAQNINITSALIVSSVQIPSSTASSVLPVSFVFWIKKKKKGCPERTVRSPASCCSDFCLSHGVATWYPEGWFTFPSM